MLLQCLIPSQFKKLLLDNFKSLKTFIKILLITNKEFLTVTKLGLVFKMVCVVEAFKTIPTIKVLFQTHQVCIDSIAKISQPIKII